MIHADVTTLSEEQRLMRNSCRAFVDEVVTPFIRQNWRKEWDMSPEGRLPDTILAGAEQIGVRTLGVPPALGGIDLERNSEVRTFALISEEIARGDSGLAAIFLHMDATVDISRMKIVKTMFPATAGKYAGPEN